MIFELSFIDNHLIELIYKLIIFNNYTINAFKNSSFNFYSLIYKNIDKAYGYMTDALREGYEYHNFDEERNDID